MLNRLRTGLNRHPKRFGADLFFTYSGLWTVIESASYFLKDIKLEGSSEYGFLLLISLCIALYRAWPPTCIRIHVKAIDAKITIKFGDLFSGSDIKVISVNEYFDSELGDNVSPASLHGQLIARYFSGHPASFNALVDADLIDVEHETVDRNGRGRVNRYPIGTTAYVRTSNGDFLLPAIAKTNIDTLKAYCDIPMLWAGLQGLCKGIRNRAGGQGVSMPLIGSGLAGVGVPANQLLQLLLLSLIDGFRQQHIASPITIVLPLGRFDDIDLVAIEAHWS